MNGRAKKILRGRKKSIWRNKFFAPAIILGIVAFAGFYFLVFSPYFQIKEIRIQGAQKLSDSDLRDFVQETSVSKILFWTSRSVFAINGKKIKENMLAQFPALAKLTVERKLPDNLLVQIVERAAVGQLCSQSQCYLIDSQAIIFEEIPSTAQTIGPLIKLDAGKTLALGETALNEAQMASALGLYKSATEKYGIELAEIIISDKKITAKASEGWEIYFDPSGDISNQILNLETILDKLLSPDKRKGLEYIDLRFGDKIYYK